MFENFDHKQVKVNESDALDVVFYIDQDGEVLAYFPEEDGDSKGNKTCYAHMGQHSACSPDYVKDLEKATAEEYAALAKELKGQGYDKLNILN